MKSMLSYRVYIIVLLVVCLWIPTSINAVSDNDIILYDFYSLTGHTLDELSQGEFGEGIIIYYLADRGPQQPGLLVHLSNNANGTRAVVYQAPERLSHVPVQYEQNRPQFPDDLIPTIIMQAQDGWWVRDGIINYNLDVQINGPVFAMWGAGGMLSLVISV
jgi:hypothetical protein